MSAEEVENNVLGLMENIQRVFKNHWDSVSNSSISLPSIKYVFCIRNSELCILGATLFCSIREMTEI